MVHGLLLPGATKMEKGHIHRRLRPKVPVDPSCRPFGTSQWYTGMNGRSLEGRCSRYAGLEESGRNDVDQPHD